MGRDQLRFFGSSGAQVLKQERGVALVEMAIAGTLFFMLLFGLAEFGRAIWMYGTIAHGAREGARYALVRGTESGRPVDDDVDGAEPSVETYVRNRAPGLATAEVTTNWTWPYAPLPCGTPVETPCKQPGAVVNVRVDVTFDPVVWFMPSIPMSTTSRMTLAF